MSLTRALNRPGWAGRFWRAVYETGYAAFRALVLLLFRPLFLVRREGPEPRWPVGGFFVCANHTSYLDPAFLQLVLRRRVTFLMTNDFYTRRAARWFFALVGAVPMTSGRMGQRGLQRAAALVRRGHVVALFPEGRLSRDGTTGPAHRGVAYLARRTRRPVVPAGIRGAWGTWPRGARWFRRSSVRVLFGAPTLWSAAAGADQRSAETAFAAALMSSIRALAGTQAATPPGS